MVKIPSAWHTEILDAIDLYRLCDMISPPTSQAKVTSLSKLCNPLAIVQPKSLQQEDKLVTFAMMAQACASLRRGLTAVRIAECTSQLLQRL